jgi:hypothetical protein
MYAGIIHNFLSIYNLHLFFHRCAGNQLIDVCGSDFREPVSTRVVRGSGHLISPGYLAEPAGVAYPMGVNCMCRLEAIANSVMTRSSFNAPVPKLHVAIYDMLLETKNGRCQADWVMIRLPNGTRVFFKKILLDSSQTTSCNGFGQRTFIYNCKEA